MRGSSIFLLRVNNAYRHQRLNHPDSGSGESLPLLVNNAYRHQRLNHYQVFFGRSFFFLSEQRLPASKVKSQRPLKTLPSNRSNTILQAPLKKANSKRKLLNFTLALTFQTLNPKAF